MKLTHLKTWLTKEERVVVAFSGGVDSTLLAYLAHETLGDNMIAVTGDSASVPSRDRELVVAFCRQHDIPHKFIETYEFEDPNYLTNPENRCYYCKKDLFTRLADYAAQNNFRSVLDGTNASDLSGHRPGYRAIKEISTIKTPFVELGITKTDIRQMCADFGLAVADKPASACLASRIPTGTKISAEDLKRVDAAENILRDAGFKQVRVRHHGDIARIQVPGSEWQGIVEMRDEIKMKVKKLGYEFVVLDLDFYGLSS